MQTLMSPGGPLQGQEGVGVPRSPTGVGLGLKTLVLENTDSRAEGEPRTRSLQEKTEDALESHFHFIPKLQTMYSPQITYNFMNRSLRFLLSKFFSKNRSNETKCFWKVQQKILFTGLFFPMSNRLFTN